MSGRPPNPSGYAFAEYFANQSNLFQGDLYINPRVRSDLPAPGGSLPLGGSTGSLIPLQNGDLLTVSVHYQNESTVNSYPLPLTNLTSATDQVNEPPLTGDVVNTFSITDDGQGGKIPNPFFNPAGYVDFQVQAPSNVTLNSGDLGSETLPE